MPPFLYEEPARYIGDCKRAKRDRPNACVHTPPFILSRRWSQRGETPRGALVEEHAAKPGLSAWPEAADWEVCEPLWLTSVEWVPARALGNERGGRIPPR